MRAQENWDAPIVVTTAVQFVESLFHNKNARCRSCMIERFPLERTRSIDQIAQMQECSVVVLDEAQTLPLPVFSRTCGNRRTGAQYRS